MALVKTQCIIRARTNGVRLNALSCIIDPILTSSPISQTTICQYNIDVTEPEELEDNCDLVLCFKDLNLDDGDFIKINHKDLQVRERLLTYDYL